MAYVLYKGIFGDKDRCPNVPWYVCYSEDNKTLFTYDIRKAHVFSRKRDAERVARYLKKWLKDENADTYVILNLRDRGEQWEPEYICRPEVK